MVTAWAETGSIFETEECGQNGAGSIADAEFRREAELRNALERIAGK